MFGTPFMPWQQYVADVAGEMVRDAETGIWVPAYPEAIVVIMRQSGKTTLKLAWSADRLVLWEAWDRRPQTAAYTAQTGTDARQKFVDDWLPAWRRSPLWGAVAKSRSSADNMGLDFRSGGHLKVLNNSESAGHGKTIDLVMLDEIWADVDASREQALGPGMNTRHDAQKLVASTAGTAKSVLLDAKMAAGRAAVDEGQTAGTAYFEWSADPTDPGYDPENPDLWWRVMPALGHTITERVIRQRLTEMVTDPEKGIAEFERAYLNVPNKGKGQRVIPVVLWDAVAVPDCRPKRDALLAIEADPAQTVACIALADADGNAKIVAYDAGTSWIVDELRRQSAGRSVVVDVRGPLGYLIDELVGAGIEVVEYQTKDMINAAALFWQRLGDGRLRLKTHAALDAAAGAARKKPVDAVWLWHRYTTPDASPLIAVTNALHAAAIPRSTAEPVFAWS